MGSSRSSGKRSRSVPGSEKCSIRVPDGGRQCLAVTALSRCNGTPTSFTSSGAVARWPCSKSVLRRNTGIRRRYWTMCASRSRRGLRTNRRKWRRQKTVALAVLSLLDWMDGHVRGYVRFRGKDLTAMRERDLRRIRGKEIAFVPQSALASLNPALSIGAHFRETWRAHCDDEMPLDRVFKLLERVNLLAPGQQPPPCGCGSPSFLRRFGARQPVTGGAAFLNLHPRELSVGMAQRVAIALALLHGPALWSRISPLARLTR